MRRPTFERRSGSTAVLTRAVRVSPCVPRAATHPILLLRPLER